MPRGATRTLTLLLPLLMLAQQPAPAPRPSTAQPASDAAGEIPIRSPFGPAQGPQPYNRVITKDAKSKSGVFTVHEVKDKYYYENWVCA
jgi:hypothetical protein